MKETETVDKKFFDPTFPLLDKFRELAPGSYKHCQNVTNMCESIAAELGLKVEILKCASLYHDIGKMNNPSYFSENQNNGTNIHEKLDPYVSYQIITRHVGDSVLHLLQTENIPMEVIDIVSQHHGNTILQAFFNKAKQEPEEKYRYKCSKPTTTEALILMIVDSIEATARALSLSGDEDFIEKAVNGTINKLMDDRQLDNMKIGTLNITKKLLFKELESIYHKRVSYDDEKTIAEINNDLPINSE
jgi:putative nucleotidyltransferase with HDIG domain